MKKLFKRLFKTEAFRRFVCFFAASYIRFVYYTSRVKLHVHEEAEGFMAGDTAGVVAFWHGRLLMMPMVRPPKRIMNVLISMHRDGEMIARTMHHFGFQTPRGSSTRGGARAAIVSVRAIQAGENVSVTPDGPKGPSMKVQPGILVIAKMASVPVIPMTFSTSRNRRMKSWDRFMVALPFGRLHYAIGKPLMDATPKQLEEAMVAQVEDMDRMAGIS